MLLWLVADDDQDALEEAQRDKALLDAEELKEDDFAADKDKVELDLDDAPFLDEEEEEEEEPEAPLREEPPPAEKPGIRELLKDKRVLGGLIGGLLLLVGVVVAVILWPEAEKPPEPPPAVEQPETPVPEEPPPPTEHLIAFKPFLVEHVNAEGQVRLLSFKFSLVTENEKLAWEITHKRLVLRDAIFYYLKNKDLRFLSDATMAEQLKNDLISVINQYLNVDQIQELLIEEYLVK